MYEDATGGDGDKPIRVTKQARRACLTRQDYERVSATDYYDILGVPRDVDGETQRRDSENSRSSITLTGIKILVLKKPSKKSTRRKVVLSDPEQRARYDRFGHEAPGASVIHFQEVFVRTTSEISLVEMFSTNWGAFSDGARRRRPRHHG